jgi:DNA-directed RNA polymerase subunit RPC12/RpoP
MELAIKCRGCGRTLIPDRSAIGKRVQCPQCEVLNPVPDPNRLSRRSEGLAFKLKTDTPLPHQRTDSQVQVTVSCTQCGGSFSFAEDRAGRGVKCPHCFATLGISGGTGSNAPQSDESGWVSWIKLIVGTLLLIAYLPAQCFIAALSLGLAGVIDNLPMLAICATILAAVINWRVFASGVFDGESKLGCSFILYSLIVTGILPGLMFFGGLECIQEGLAGVRRHASS